MVNTEAIEWRNAEQILPESSDTVLLKVKAGGVFESFCQGGRWYIYGASGLQSVRSKAAYWAPMPSGPNRKKV